MVRFRNAHRWLSLALLIVLLGFMRSYWSRLPEVDWMHHLHLLSATAWFVLLVWQPRLATTGRLAQHRRNGMIGLFLAGATVGTALLMLPGNIEDAVSGRDNGFIYPAFFYGITFFDLVTIAGFAGSVIMAILRSKQPEEHALWMVSTAFWIIGPAFVRLMVLPVVMIHGPEGLTFFKVAYFTMPVVLAAIAVTAWRVGRAHPALVLAFLANATVYVCEPIGNSPAWQAFCEALLLPPSE